MTQPLRSQAKFPLRHAQLLDAPVLAALHGACFETAWEAAAFGTFLADAGSACLIAMESDSRTPAGFVLARAVADEAEILTIAVAPARRRCGVARSLMQAAQAALAERGARRLFLEVGAGNVAARALYAGLGFREAGRREAYYRDSADGPAEDAILLARDLDQL